MDADHKQHEINEILPYLRPDFLELDKYHKAIKNELHSHLTWPFTKDFTDSQEPKYVPLDNRKPLITVPIGKQIVETVVSYTFGKGNFPKVSAKTTRDIYPGKGYSLDAVNAKLSRFITQLVTKSFLNASMMSAARLAVGIKKCIVYFKYVNGKPVWEVLNWKWVQNEQYDTDNKTLISFDYITFEFGVDEEGEDCIWLNKCRYDQQGEYVYAPVKHEDDVEPQFTTITKESIHNLGFCPAVVLCANENEESIFDEAQIDNIFQYSIFVSCTVVGIRKNMNPQRIWMGDTPPNLQNLIRSSDTVWAMPEGKFISDAPNPQAYQYAIEMEQRLREIILRGSRTVEIPNKNYQSGEALKMKIAPELNLIQETRTELGDRGMVDLLTMAMKVTCKLNERIEEYQDAEGNVIIKNKLKLGPDVEIPSYDMLDEVDITLGWGEIFIPTAESKNLDIQTAVMATKADENTGADPLFSELTTRTAMASHMNVTDMNSEQAQIERERVNRLNNKAISALIELCQKNNRPDLLLILLDGLNEENSLAMEYEYQNTMDVSKITQKISAALENVEEVTDAKAGIVETETEDSGESDGEEYQQGS